MLRLFLRTEVAERLDELYRSGRAATAEELSKFRAARAARPRLSSRLCARPAAARGSSSEPENYAVLGNTGHIEIHGLLSEEPDFLSWLLGADGTTYYDIRTAFSLAASNPAVSSVELHVDSPGGYVDGLFETLAVLEAFGKPVQVHGAQACSAAYALAAMAGPIRATNPAAEFGSVGVAASYRLDPSRLEIASSEAPHKRPNLRTDEGVAVIRSELDALHELFVDAIARGRQHATGERFDTARVNATFGRGGVFLAEQAQAARMIDGTAPAVLRGSAIGAAANGSRLSGRAPAPELIPTPRTPRQQQRTMDKEKLKAEFPELYAAVFEEGRTAERKRVSAHLKMGSTSGIKVEGALKVAHNAIVSGASVLDEEVHAEYMSAALSRQAQVSRQADSDTAGAALGDASTSGSANGARDMGDLVADALERQLGKKAK